MFFMLPHTKRTTQNEPLSWLFFVACFLLLIHHQLARPRIYSLPCPAAQDTQEERHKKTPKHPFRHIPQAILTQHPLKRYFSWNMMSTVPATSKGKRPLRHLTASDKIDAIQRIHDGESKASVARDIGVPESTLRGWCKNEEKLRYMSRQSTPDKPTADKMMDKLDAALVAAAAASDWSLVIVPYAHFGVIFGTTTTSSGGFLHPPLGLGRTLRGRMDVRREKLNPASGSYSMWSATKDEIFSQEPIKSG
uniref:Protein distal antenna n=1 Tax=Lutzomyia longipalpis TaxID=7200 RepID=A0A1B0GJC4_LUTLO